MSKPLRRSYVDGPFGQIHVRTRAGQAASPPVLYCLHQSPKSGLEFDVFLHACPQAWTVVAPDYPGYGQSDPPPREQDATIEAYAASMWAVADALGHGRIALFGNHTGAKVAAAMALARPQAVAAIIMVSAALLTPQERAEFTSYFQPVPLDEAGTRFTDMWARIHKHAGPGMTLEMKARSFLQNQMGGEAYEWGHAAAFAYDAPFRQALATLEQPILVLNPEDELTEATRRAAPLLRNGRVQELPGYGHGMLDLRAETLAALVTDFAAQA
jgi:pimeloyl-ACP methyl ester carboxylesterase